MKPIFTSSVCYFHGEFGQRTANAISKAKKGFPFLISIFTFRYACSLGSVLLSSMCLHIVKSYGNVLFLFNAIENLLKYRIRIYSFITSCWSVLFSSNVNWCTVHTHIYMRIRLAKITSDFLNTIRKIICMRLCMHKLSQHTHIRHTNTHIYYYYRNSWMSKKRNKHTFSIINAYFLGIFSGEI